MDMGCVLLRLAWNLSPDHQMEMTKNENGNIPEKEYKTGKLLNILSEVFTKLACVNNCSISNKVPFKPTCSKWYLMKGKEMLQVNTKLNSGVCLLQIKICRRYFKAAMSVEDEHSESINTTLNIYLAALYFVSHSCDKAWKYLASASLKHIKSNTASRCPGAHRASWLGLFVNFRGLSFLLEYVTSRMRVTISSKSEYAQYRKLHLQQGLRHFLESKFISLPLEWHPVFNDLKFESNLTSSAGGNDMTDVYLNLSSEDKLAEMLTKLSIQQLCKFDKFSSPEPSHFLVLFLYHQKCYHEVLNMCEALLARPETMVEKAIVSVTFAFQNLFADDVTFLLGLMLLIDGNLQDLEADRIPTNAGCLGPSGMFSMAQLSDRFFHEQNGWNLDETSRCQSCVPDFVPKSSMFDWTRLPRIGNIDSFDQTFLLHDSHVIRACVGCVRNENISSEKKTWISLKNVEGVSVVQLPLCEVLDNPRTKAITRSWMWISYTNIYIYIYIYIYI